jgi:hypothetical protein
MSENTGAERSRDACPVCGQYALELLYFPTVDVTGVRPYDELLGLGDAKATQEPGIGCRSCGTSWPSLAAFRASRAGDDEAS